MKLVASTNRCIKCGNISEGHLCKSCRTITVIDLLVKIADDEELPKKVKYDGVIFENKDGDLLNDIDCSLFEHRGNGYEKLLPMLNDEIEIVDELEETEDLPTISEEQALFNKLNSKDQEYILNFMKMLQPCKNKRNGDEND